MQLQKFSDLHKALIFGQHYTVLDQRVLGDCDDDFFAEGSSGRLGRRARS